MNGLAQFFSVLWQRAKAWLFQERHRMLARRTKRRALIAFGKHPLETGETYWQHLWFTLRMSGRFFYIGLAIVVHGLFPFLCVRTASNEIQKVYGIMKTRVPKMRRESDTQYDI